MRKSDRFNYLILTYIAGIIVFTLFRLVETIAYSSITGTELDFDGLYCKALLMGWRFDTVVSCYVLAIPLLLLIVGEIANIKRRWYYAIAHYTAMVLYSVCFFACAADIPYFCYFFNRLDVVALSWIDDLGTSLSMIVHEPMYILYLGVFIAVAVGWWLLGRLLFRHVLLPHLDKRLPVAWSIVTSLLLLGGLFLGMRGKLSKIPIRVSTAYFCNNHNTLFVFIADHGASMNPVYDMVLAYNHVPMLFFAPKHILPHFDDRLAMQIDVAPTIAAMVGAGHYNRMMGTDLTTHTRKYAYFSADDKIGVVDGELFYLYRTKAQNASLYRYKDKSTNDIIGSMPERAARMRNHAFGMIQSSQRMLSEGKTSCDLDL